MTTTNSFKKWIMEEEEALDGAEKVLNKAVSAFQGGEKAGEKAVQQQVTKDKEEKAKSDETQAQEMIKDINTHVQSMFADVSNPSTVGTPEDLLGKFESRKSALQAFEIYKGMAKTLTDIQSGFNSRLVQTRKITQPELKALMARAKQDADSGILDKQIEAFAKSEAKFFSEVLNIPEVVNGKSDAFDNMKFDKSAFVQRLSNRFSNTVPTKIPKTIEAINTLLTYLIGEFTQYAKTIGDAGRQRPKDE